MAARVAEGQAEVAESMVTVAAMQRAAALLRHEFAVQSLVFLRNRPLSSELWYRLAHLIRGVSETYLRYAIELSFLAEQSYEFEVDKRVNVIRFDYDVSEVSRMLAADFLLADLDTLEQDLLVGERTRQQPVRYIVSLAREFPESLRELRESGSTIFTIPLEGVERRIPGFYNLRIGSTELIPIALMDRTRFGVEMTHLGASQVRLRAMPDSPRTSTATHHLNEPDITSWLPGLDAEWPVKIRIYGAETAVFSGITTDTVATDAAFSFAASAQRGAFEHRGVAGSRRIDMSMSENKIVPGSLTDFLIAFNLNGYHNPVLRDAIDRAPRGAAVATQWLSARTYFPDAFYRFQQTGTMRWDVRDGLSVLGSRAGALRNGGVMLVPAARRPSFGHAITSHVLVFEVAANGNLSTLNEIPAIALMPTGLHLDATVALGEGANAHWSFDEGATWQTGGTVAYDYRRPGSYEITLRIERSQRLSEHQIALATSDVAVLESPLLVRPTVQTGTGDGTPVTVGLTRVVASAQPVDDETNTIWKIPGRVAAVGPNVQFDLVPGRYALSMATIRSLRSRFYNLQRYLPSQAIDVVTLTAVSNRRFDEHGNDITASPNALTTHLFGAGAIGPGDLWSLELPLADNPSLRTVSRAGAEEASLREIQDAILILEYETD